MTKEFLSGIAIALTLAAFFPSVRSVLSGRTKPHVFSWVIWGSTTFIVFLAQLADEGGAGAWPIGVSGVITIGVAALAFAKRGDIAITRIDWAFFIAAMSSLPLWWLTSDPLWAVVILTLVDVLGFGPTIRKACGRPFEEQVTFYALMATRNAVSVAALEHYSLTTVLFPAVLSVVAASFVAMVLVRRRTMRGERTS
jgi:hypothetical protein